MFEAIGAFFIGFTAWFDDRNPGDAIHKWRMDRMKRDFERRKMELEIKAKELELQEREIELLERTLA